MIAAAVLLGLFATAESLSGAIGWRLGIGVAAACGFVPIAGLLARWFQPEERGMANGAYYGLGGGLGEATAFLLLPLLSIYFLNRPDLAVSGWRAAMVAIAALIAGIGMICLVILKSGPGESVARPFAAASSAKEQRRPWLSDPALWLLGLYFAAGIVALRLVPAWLPLYATDLYRARWGYAQEAAVVAGGAIGVIYVIGHVVGSPLIGRLSDFLLARGISRISVAASGLAVSTVAFGLLAVPMASPWLLGTLALLIGVSLHTFPVVNAAAAERWGVERAGESLGWINMVGQFAGAVSLSVSGYVGMAAAAGRAASQSPDPLGEYVGIWYLGAASSGIGALVGWLAHRTMRNP
jgi:MFS family permease